MCKWSNLTIQSNARQTNSKRIYFNILCKFERKGNHQLMKTRLPDVTILFLFGRTSFYLSLKTVLLLSSVYFILSNKLHLSVFYHLSWSEIFKMIIEILKSMYLITSTKGITSITRKVDIWYRIWKSQFENWHFIIF